jgi:hypothetical protein
MHFFPSTLYYASGALNEISIPGHISFGIQHVDRAVDEIPHSQGLALGKATATTAWDMVNGMLTALGKPMPSQSICWSSVTRKRSDEETRWRTNI